DVAGQEQPDPRQSDAGVRRQTLNDGLQHTLNIALGCYGNRETQKPVCIHSNPQRDLVSEPTTEGGSIVSGRVPVSRSSGVRATAPVLRCTLLRLEEIDRTSSPSRLTQHVHRPPASEGEAESSRPCLGKIDALRQRIGAWPPTVVWGWL